MTTSLSSPGPVPGSAAPSRSATPARARKSPRSTSTARPQRRPGVEIGGAGGKAQAVTLDITDRAACAAVAAQVAARVGPVSVLVNNAGINRRNPFTGDAGRRHQGLDRHHGGQSRRHVQRDPRLPRPCCARARDGSSTSRRCSRSCTCARRTRPPTPPRSTACSALPARSPQSSARRACASTPSGPGLIETAINAQARASNPEMRADGRRPHAARPHR